MWIFKKKAVPETNDTKEVDAVKLWIVEWRSRHGAFSGDLRNEYEAFPHKEDAEHFAQSLRAAFKLIKHTSNTSVNVRES